MNGAALLRSRRWARVLVVAGQGLAALYLLLVAIAALAPELLTAVSPLQTDSAAVLQPPSSDHLFGTDQSGRDVFSRVIHGAGPSVLVGVRAVGIALVLGAFFGVLAGFAPRFVDSVVSRATEVVMAFPEFLVALLVVAILGRGPDSVALGVTVAIVPAYLRMARVQTRLLRGSGVVESSRLLGAPPWLTALRHIVPGVLGSLGQLALLGFGSAVVSAAGLSFLGLGLQPPAPEWGVIMNEGRNQLHNAWWIILFSGLALCLTVVAVTVLARGLAAHRERARA